MKIGFMSLMNGFPWGGSEQFWFAAARHARANGYEVYIKNTDWESRKPEQIGLLREAGINVTHFPRFKRMDYLVSKFDKGYLAKRKNKDVLQFLDKIDFLVISQGGTYDFLYYPELEAGLKAYKKKYVVINHFNFDHKITEWRSIEKAQVFFKNAALVFFVSERNRLVTEHQILYKFPNVEILRNPINIPRPFPRKFADKGTVQFACVARLEADFKGQDLLIPLLATEKWRNRNWVLNIYGSGPDEKYLRALTALHGMTKKIIFRGFFAGVEEIWQNSDVLVMPSFAEGTPISLVEAFSCGRVVVTTDVGGNGEWISNGKNGYLAPYATPASFDQSLESCWQNRSNWNIIGAEAFKTFSRFYESDPIKVFLKRFKKLFLANFQDILR